MPRTVNGTGQRRDCPRMADLETKYGEDAAQALYMWRFAGVSFGLEARFWWTLLGSLATASLTALGAIVYKVIQERIEDHTWLTNELKDGLPYDGTTSIPGGTRAFGEWGSGKWIWMAYSVAGGAVIALLKFVATLLAGRVLSTSPSRMSVRGARTKTSRNSWH